MTETKPMYCSFCGKSQHEVRKLIAGPTVFICDECTTLCMDIVEQEAGQPSEHTIAHVVRWLRKQADTPWVGINGNWIEAAETLRKCLPSDHPLHPNQDQDDVPELGDPRA